MRYSILLIFSLSTNMMLSAQSCPRPLENCKEYSQKINKGLLLKIDTSYSQTIEFIFWNLTSSPTCINSYNNELDISIEYLDTISKIWKSVELDMICGTGYKTNQALPYSYTRKKISTYSFNGDEIHPVRFYIGSSDTVIYTQIVNLKIDPQKFKSLNEQRLYFVDKILQSNKANEEQKQSALYFKAFILSEENKFLESLTIFEELNNRLNPPDKISYRYALVLMRYYKIEQNPITKYLIILKCIDLLEKLSGSEKYKLKSSKLLSGLRSELSGKDNYIKNKK